MDSLRRLLKRWLIILFALVFVFAGCAFLYQEKLIYFPSSYRPAELEGFAKVGGVTLDYETAEGAQHAYYFSKAGAPAAKTLPERLWIVTGGNAARALGWVGFFSAHGRPDEGYLLIDYPGYGANKGNPSPASIRESITAAVTAAAAHFGVAEKELTSRISVLGHSLGAAAALTTAIDHGAEKIVIVSPFTSMKDMAARTVGKSLSHILVHRFDNRASLRALEDKGIPVTIFHGENDTIVPTEMGKELAGMFPDWIKFVPVPDAGHNDIFDVAARPIAGAMAP